MWICRDEIYEKSIGVRAEVQLSSIRVIPTSIKNTGLSTMIGLVASAGLSDLDQPYSLYKNHIQPYSLYMDQNQPYSLYKDLNQPL